MLISVVGTTGLGRVAGVPVGRPASLLRVVAERPDQRVVVLAPRHAESAARGQADLVAAARPTAQVQVVVSRHHALTLTLAADRALRTAERSGTVDVWDLLAQELAAARSLIWCPSVWRLAGASLSLGQRLRSLAAGPGFFVELGDRSRLDDARDGWHPRPDDRLYAAAPAPALMIAQLGASAPVRAATDIEPGAPYAPRSARLLTVLPPESTRSAGTPVPADRPTEFAAGAHGGADATDNPQESEAA